MVTTLTKTTLSDVLNQFPMIKAAILSWDDKTVEFDETKLTANQITALTNFLNSLGYK